MMPGFTEIAILVVIVAIIFGSRIFKPATNVFKAAKDGVKNFRKEISDDKELADTFDSVKDDLMGSVKRHAANDIEKSKRQLRIKS